MTGRVDIAWRIFEKILKFQVYLFWDFFFFLAQTTNNLIFEGVCEHVDEHIVGGGWVHAQKQNIYDVSLNKS